MSSLETALVQMWKDNVKDPYTFLFGSPTKVGMVKTLDEHDQEQPIKFLPDRPHLRELTRLAEESPLLAIGKSRQLMVSWWGMAYLGWALQTPGRRLGVMCRKFELADILLDRMWGVQQRIPIPEKIGKTRIRPRAVRKEGVISVQHPGGADSICMALAQDSDAPRSLTFSKLWVDEAAFTDSLDAVLQAAMPTVMAGGQIILASSPNGRGEFYNILCDYGRLEF